jgi:hypothetical protein
VMELNFPNPVSEEKDFYGRRAQLEHIEQVFLSGSPKPVIAMGERRIGKTSLQLVTTKRLMTRGEGRFVSLLLPPAQAIRSFDDYGKEMLQRLCSYLGKNLQETGLTDDRGRFQLADIGQFTAAAARLLEGTPDKTFIVCLDEFDTVLLNCDAAEADRILALTEHISERSELPLLIYFTMTSFPESVRDSYSSTVIAHSEVIELGPFSQSETIEMVTGLLQDQVVLEDLAMERLFHLSGGHPYFVKLLLDHLLARHGEGPGLIISQQMLDEVIPEAVRDPRARHALDNIYKVHFSRPEQQLVLLLAERGAGITGEELRAVGAGFLTAAKRLHRRGYLARWEVAGYNFRIEFLTHWLCGWDEYDEEWERLSLAEIQQLIWQEPRITSPG